VEKATWISLKNFTTNFFLVGWGGSITQEINVIRISPPWKSGTSVSGVPVLWLFIAGHLEETFHRQHITEIRPLVLFRYCMYSLCYDLDGPGIESR
jgi:hypothetical protein